MARSNQDFAGAETNAAIGQLSSSDNPVSGMAARLAELEAETATLRAQARQSSLILDSATDYAIITMDIDGLITSWNVGAQNILGYAEGEILGRSGEIIFTSEDRMDGRFSIELSRAIEAGTATNERWHLRRDGTRFWASGTMMPLLDLDGRPQGFLNILRDRTDVRAEMERRELFMAEMNHRIKNTFSAVQAVAALTRRHAPSVAAFQEAFDARLMVLARSHEVLIQSDWDEAPLWQVMERALEPYGGQPCRITLDGAPIMLPASLVVSVSLVFHELATNAVKHGALSEPDGKVDVAWTITPTRKAARRLDIKWRERGGPIVQPPGSRGFGSQLLERGIPSGGTVQQHYQPEGLECHITLPLTSAG